MSNPRRALIVIDVQNEYFTGLLPIEHPPREGSLANITRAMDAAKELSIPIVVVQHTLPTGAPVFDKASPTWQLHPEIARRPHDFAFEKSQASALVGTPLRGWLMDRGIDTLTLVGYMTQNCVVGTALDAGQTGLEVELLSDATGALSYQNSAGRATAAELHRAVTAIVEANFGTVSTTEAWLGYVKGGKKPERDNIIVSNQRARQSM